jgi:hypothetical protein
MDDQVKNLIQIRKTLKRGKAGNLAENKAFLDFLAIQKQMEKEFADTWAVIRARMDAYDIKKISGDWGYIGYVPYPTYKAEGKIAPRFFKEVLDGEQVRHYMKNHSGKVPAGVKVINTLRFRKDIKLEA